MQEDHDLADDPLLGPASDNSLRPLRADARHLAKPFWLSFDDVEDLHAEGPHQFLRIDRADAADHAGAEIFLDPLDGRRGHGLEKASPELEAMLPIVVPFAARLDEFSGRYDGSVADDGDEITFTARLDAENGEAVVLVVECHPLDQAGEDLGRGLSRVRLHDAPNVVGSRLPGHFARVAIMPGTDRARSAAAAPRRRSHRFRCEGRGALRRRGSSISVHQAFGRPSLPSDRR